MIDIAAIILAAGRSSRYRDAGGQEASKLVASLDGKPLVRHVAEAALGSQARPVVVVTGHERARIARALEGLPVQFTHNNAFASGMASSLKAGLAALPKNVGGVLILLADMPHVSSELLDRIGAEFACHSVRLAVVPTFHGRRGNPVLLSRALFPAIGALDGDEGARNLLAGAPPGAVVEIAVDEEAAIVDIDTPEALASARQALRGDRK